MKAETLRMAGARICLAMILALLVVPGYIVAPVLFAKAGSIAEAGMLAGHIFHSANVAVLLFAAALALFWRRMGVGLAAGSTRWRWLLLATVAVLTAVNEFALAPVMADLKQQMGPIDLVPKNDPLRRMFGLWHGISSVLHMLASLAAAVLVGLGARPPAEGRDAIA